VSIPLNSSGPLAFIPPVVAPIAANNIVPLAIAAAAGVGAVGAVVAGSPIVAGVAVAAALVAGAELLLPRPVGGDNPQSWGVTNGPPRSAPVGLDFNEPSGTFVSGGTTADGQQYIEGGHIYGIKGPNGFVNGFSETVTGTGDVRALPGSLSWKQVFNDPINGAYALGYTACWTFLTGGGGCGSSFDSSGRFYLGSFQLAIEPLPTNAGTNIVELQPSTEAAPWLGAPAAVLIGQQAVPAPLPLPAYPSQPATQPEVPNAEPITQPEPALVPGSPGAPNPTITPSLPRPYAPPWITPGNPTPSDPARFPDNPTQPTQPTSPDGAIVPVPVPAPVTTPEGSIIPWPGAPPIPAIGTPPQPTMEGIATEVGRIERKLELMNNGKGNGDLTDRLQLLGTLLNQLLDLLSAVGAGTTYTLDSPCEVDDEGVILPPVEVEAPGASSQFGVLLNRFDALAELIQIHKNLKQPGCKHKLAGEIVSVNFEQIE
jgi:hypothetical protein